MGFQFRLSGKKVNNIESLVDKVADKLNSVMET